MVKIIFDSNNSLWENDWDCNRFFLYHQICHFKDLIKHRGYLYLNQIYECLGVKWSPYKENVCYKNPVTFFIDFKKDGDDKIIITID